MVLPFDVPAIVLAPQIEHRHPILKSIDDLNRAPNWALHRAQRRCRRTNRHLDCSQVLFIRRSVAISGTRAGGRSMRVRLIKSKHFRWRSAAWPLNIPLLPIQIDVRFHFGVRWRPLRTFRFTIRVLMLIVGITAIFCSLWVWFQAYQGRLARANNYHGEQALTHSFPESSIGLGTPKCTRVSCRPSSEWDYSKYIIIYCINCCYNFYNWSRDELVIPTITSAAPGVID